MLSMWLAWNAHQSRMLFLLHSRSLRVLPSSQGKGLILEYFELNKNIQPTATSAAETSHVAYDDAEDE
ncbi:hypothetical protein Cob_v011914 [Colletotrichum orbiculare MAFF 240422]|uniref:Uncharacterized protein n=1 Tax=Colletotrichum orbiculare (strain 104-T / ATCC 96160 / CBS 514.97 / LARS 414 / MAFF 240422) TaxID=1213857 RepID=A0A484FA44_COLOR|nr:hypothetical protein Cob_v011914 [Colletotrichum orbiculare MAFF 240422]